ncbi:MAG: hypothetical protein COX57_02505 [Alphaproteobacteria bacterium CG_4_10_14_0_2_um_filter_63_37]|nr:MAG: hypothetical protein AUJ55_13275 [Proteobacteria bacterium CG1_02_64_396]PJA25631.1 MAG: hypothetical protein COX57_02505 [Alphaproteobacteria bacterium CG_4_10_14_0_2_um_filter_63_37]
MALVDPKLLEILVCPQCKGKVTVNAKASRLECPACNLAYPVRDGIPVMLVDEAAPLESDNKE